MSLQKDLNKLLEIYHKKDFELLNTESEKSISKHGFNTELNNFLGVSFLMLQKHEEASQVFEELIEKSPNFSQAYINLGVIYQTQKKFEKAKELYLKAVDQKDINDQVKATAYKNLGIMAMGQNEYDNAAKFYFSSLELEDSDVITNIGLGNALNLINKPKEAIIYYEKALELDPDLEKNNPTQYEEMSYALGVCYKEEANFIKAAEYLKVIKLGFESNKEEFNYKVESEISKKDQENFIKMWNIQDNSISDDLINFFDNNPALQNPGRSYKGMGDSKEDKDSMDVTIRPELVSKNKVISNYIKYLNHFANEYCEEYEIVKYIPLQMGAFNIQKYNTGGHFKSVHSERMSKKNMYRVFAWMTYLNDVDDGGETFFSHYDISIKPRKGRTIIWPAEWTHAHKGEVVNSGEKYIITGWFDMRWG